jgi:hypothetical protein
VRRVASALWAIGFYGAKGFVSCEDAFTRNLSNFFQKRSHNITSLLDERLVKSPAQTEIDEKNWVSTVSGLMMILQA